MGRAQKKILESKPRSTSKMICRTLVCLHLKCILSLSLSLSFPNSDAPGHHYPLRPDLSLLEEPHSGANMQRHLLGSQGVRGRPGHGAWNNMLLRNRSSAIILAVAGIQANPQDWPPLTVPPPFEPVKLVIHCLKMLINSVLGRV